MICQNYGRFVCNKCERVFHFEQELKSHFNDHNIAEINRTAHYCEHCTLSFLKESELKAHQITPRHFEKKAAQAAEIGLKYLICAYKGPQKTIDHFKQFNDEFNRCGEICKKNGIKFAYHNHDYSFKMVDGQM